MTWHVLRTRWGAELDVARSLAYETVCPKRLVARRVGRLRLLEERAVFSPYVFVRAPLAEDPEAWHEVAAATGVIEIMGGMDPWPVTQAEMDALLLRVDGAGYMVDSEVAALLARYRRGFDVGDQVRIVRGKWRGFQGEVAEITGDILVTVKTALFRREVALYVLADNCEVVENRAPEDRVPPELVVRHHPQRRGGRRGVPRRQTA